MLNAEHENEPAHQHPRPSIYAAETTGLVVIALLLLVLTLIRYWHSLHWSLR